MKFKLKMNRFDIICIPLLTVTAIIISCLIFFLPSNKGGSVSIYIQSKEEYSLDLNIDQILILKKGEYNKELHQYPSLLDDMTIEIKNKKVRVEKEESPLHVCSKQGYVSKVNMPIVCAPNAVVIIIKQNSAKDIIVNI